MTAQSRLLACGAVLLSVSILMGQEDCSTDDLEISGVWHDDYGARHDIDSTEWLMEGPGYSSAFYVDTYDNMTNYLVAQNSPDNDWYPGLWSRFDWTEPDETGWYYCQTVYNAPTAEEAESAEPADSSDLDGGCGGFPWTHME